MEVAGNTTGHGDFPTLEPIGRCLPKARRQNFVRRKCSHKIPILGKSDGWFNYSSFRIGNGSDDSGYDQ